MTTAFIERIERPDLSDLPLPEHCAIESAMAFMVCDAGSYTIAQERIREARQIIKARKEKLDPLRELTHAAHKAATRLIAEAILVPERVDEILSGKATRYAQEEERLRRVEEARIQAELRRREEEARLAEAMQREAEERQRRAEAERAEAVRRQQAAEAARFAAEGRAKEAEAARQREEAGRIQAERLRAEADAQHAAAEAVIAAPIVVAPVVLPTAAPRVEGMSMRTRAVGRVVDPVSFAAWCVNQRRVSEFFDVRQASLNALARNCGIGSTEVPGVVFEPDVGFTAR